MDENDAVPVVAGDAGRKQPLLTAMPRALAAWMAAGARSQDR